MRYRCAMQEVPAHVDSWCVFSHAISCISALLEGLATIGLGLRVACISSWYVQLQQHGAEEGRQD